MGFWDRVKAEVKRQNTTLEWLALKTDISKRTLYGWIAKGVLPRVDEAYLISSALGVSMEFLVTGEVTVSDPWATAHQDFINDMKKIPTEQQTFIIEGARAQADKVRKLEDGRLGKSSPSA